MSDRERWAWRPQNGPQKALVVRLRSFGEPVTSDKKGPLAIARGRKR
jgi:hypothetical protein